MMSTYLLAFVVGEYDFIESRSANRVLIRVYTPLEKAKQGQHGLDAAVKCLDYFTEYFGIPFPLKKLDLIAISDFAAWRTAGAMENWGLITYRESRLLVDKVASSPKSQELVAQVVCHELAHQWFGNLVTMEWWTHLWLNEGFANFMQHVGTDDFEPKYEVWSQFLTDAVIVALYMDALDNSHPIEVPVGHPDEVDEIFDLISYQKGGSVIPMLNQWIGDDNFNSGSTSTW